MIKTTIAIFTTFLLSFPQPENISVFKNTIDSSLIGKMHSVVILGNSITYHSPSEKVSWKGNWGMAASVQDSDFVHILTRKIKGDVRFKNISEFERGYQTYDLSKLDSFRNTDILILKIGENVNGKTAADSGFIGYYNKLIKYINPKIIVSCDGFWRENPVNKIIAKNAIDSQYIFVALTDIQSDSTTMALKSIEPGVAKHPSDKGMRIIADRIWKEIEIYFK